MSQATETNEFAAELEKHREPPAAPKVEAFSANVPTDIDLFDHSAESEARRDQQRKLGVETPPYPADAGPIPALRPYVMVDATTGDIFGTDSSGEKIVVTAEEAERFLRAALNDVEMWFDVQPINGNSLSVRVAVPTEAFTTNAYAMVGKWPNVAEDSVSWVLAMQQAHIWYSVRAIDGSPVSWGDRFLDKPPLLSELVQVLRDPTDAMGPIFEMSAPRWKLLVEASRLAEMKYKTCVAAWRNRDFFAGGDGA